MSASPSGRGGFIPKTMNRLVRDGVFFRPIRSWHSATYAGERLDVMPGGKDRSGCMFPDKFHGLNVCLPPLTVTHRLYWHESAPDKTVSAFLSYPDAMGYADGYFWEVLGIDPEDIVRFDREDAEAEMEEAIVTHFRPINSQE